MTATTAAFACAEEKAQRPGWKRCCRQCPSCRTFFPGGGDDMPERDPQVEHDFLQAAERLAGLDIGWTELVEARLARMDASKGRDGFLELGFWRCVAETDEEGFDCGGWPLMAYHLSFAEFADDPDRGDEARMLLQEIAAYGVRVHGVVQQLRNLR